MLKSGKKILLLIFLLALAFTFVACSQKNEGEEGDAEKEEKIEVNYADIASIEVVDAEILEETGFLLDDFSVSSIKLSVKYLSEEEEPVEIPVSERMIRAEDKAKLSVAGTHTITLYYGKFTIQFKLKLFRNIENSYRVTFMDWEGNRLGDAQYLKSGQIASVPNLESREGYQFIGWKNSETGAIVTDFAFTSDVTLVASYAPDYYSVDYYYVIGEEERYLSSEMVRRGGDAYDFAPAIPIVEGYSNGRWSDRESMRNVDSDGLTFYAVFDKDYVNATFVYYKFVEGEWYSYDVYWKVAEATEGISAPDDVRRVSSDIFLYWYVKHGDVEVRVDFPYVLTAETTFYAKYIPAQTGSQGIDIRYVDATGGVEEEGYYIFDYNGDDDIIAISTDIGFSSGMRYVFVPSSVATGEMLSDNHYCREGDYLYKTTDQYALENVAYYNKYSVVEQNGVYDIYLPASVTPGDTVPTDVYYESREDGFVLTSDRYFDAVKKYFLKKRMIIQSGDFYLQEDFAVDTILEAGKYYYAKDNAFILLTEESKAKLSLRYFTKMKGLSVNGTALFAEENRTDHTKAVSCFVPQNKTMIRGLLGHPFADNGAERFFVANNNTVFRINNDSLYSIDLKTLYAYPTGKKADAYTIESKRLPIVEIADYAFYGAKNLRFVTLPNTILTIGNYAFAECSSLESFVVPASVTSIGNGAFSGAVSIASYSFKPNSSLTTIGEKCFAKNYRLETVALPTSVTSIGRGVFSDCVALTNIDLENDYFTVDRANGGLYGQKDAMSYYYLYAFPAKFPGSSNGVIIINSGARVVCSGAFSRVSLFEIAFESKNNSIAFESGSVVCPTLRTVRLNCTLVTLNDHMFTDPSTGESFFPNSFYLDQETASALGGCLNDSAFSAIERRQYHDTQGRVEYRSYSDDFGYVMTTNGNDQTVTITGYRGVSADIVVPETINNAVVTAIDSNAFRGNKTIVGVVLPDSVYSIGEYAFYGCENLQVVSFGTGLKRISSYAFAGCKNLGTVDFTDRTNINEVGEHVFDGDETLLGGEEFVVIGGVLFAYNGIDDVVVIPDYVYVIADRVFENCVSAEKIVFGADSQLTSILSYAFHGCDSVFEIVLPTALHIVGEYAFSDCAKLFAAVFVSDVDYPDNAFSGSGSFYPGGATNVFKPENTAFNYEFDGIATGSGYYVLTAPQPAENGGVFKGWYTNDERTVLAEFPSILSSNAVFYAKYDASVRETDGIVYEQTDNGYEVIGYVGTDKYVTVPAVYRGKKVTSIGADAFLNKNVVYFSLPDTIKSIGRNAFAGTAWLDGISTHSATIGSFLIKYNGFSEEYKLADNIKYIAEGAFEGNTSLRVLHLNDVVASVPDYCFYGCSSLEKVTFGKALTEIGKQAFADNEALKDIDFSDSTRLAKVHYTAFDNSYWKKHYPDDSIVINKIFYAYVGSNETVHVPNSITLINPYAFYGNKTIRYVYVPESCLTIGECAFAESSLEKIFFATTINNLNSIERRAFYRCTQAVDYNFRACYNLVSVGEEAFCGVRKKTDDILLTFYFSDMIENMGERVFAESDVYAVYFAEDSRLIEIPIRAFYNCKELVSVRFFGDSYLQSISDEAFLGCSSLVTFTNDTALLTDIGQRAFYGCLSLNVLGINDSALFSVGNDAFAYSNVMDDQDVMVFLGSVLMKYNGIQSTVYIPAKTTEISNGAFIDNDRIGAVEFLGNELLTIRRDAFMNCDGITRFVLPDSVESIEEGAFAGCSLLTSFAAQSADAENGYTTDSGVLFRYYTENDKRYAELVAYPNKHAGVYEVPSSIVKNGNPFTVVGICDYAFYKCSDLRRITLPNSLTEVGDYAFFGCSSLTSVDLPASVSDIGVRAFASCSSLTSLSFGGTEEEWDRVDLGAFWMGSLRSISTSDATINTIADGSVYESEGITYRVNYVVDDYYATVIGYDQRENAVTCIIKEYIDEIMVLVTAIEENCFEGADFVSVDLPGSIKTVGRDAFFDCDHLKTVYFGGDADAWCGITFENEYSNPIRSAESLFINEVMVTSAVLQNATEIKKYAFIGYDALLSVVIPASVVSIDEKAFYLCSGLERVDYAGDIASWCALDFYDPYSNPLYYAHNLYVGGELIGNVVLPKSVTAIGDYCFSGCENITGFSCESDSELLTVGRHAFSYCYGLISVSIPASTTTIADYAFYICNGMSSLSFADGSALNSIGDNAFYECTALTNLVVPDAVETIGAYAFSDCVLLASVTIPDGVTSIGDHAFDNCQIRSVVAPASVLSFFKKTTLESLTVTSGTTISENAFAGCGVLSTLILSSSITSIGTDAFFGCPIAVATVPAVACEYVKNSYLQEINIISGESIASRAFINCDHLSTVRIAGTVTEIGSEAFSGCSLLTSVYFDGEIAQWLAVVKGADWDSATGSYTVHCTNGDVAK